MFSKYIDKKVNVYKYNLLILYNITFYYHNENIKLIDYYLDNLSTMFDKININNGAKLQFIINFLVSDINVFMENLKNNQYDIQNENISNKCTFNETSTDLINLTHCQIKIKNYDFTINIYKINSLPNKYINEFDFNNIKNYENDKFVKINKNNVDFGTSSIGFKRYVSNIMTWNLYTKLLEDNISLLTFNTIKTFLFQIDFGSRIGMPIILHPNIKDIISKNNKHLHISKYYYESIKFLSNSQNIIKKYQIKLYDDIEHIFTIYDFYYFIIPHIENVLNNFDILHFTALCFNNNQIKILYENKEISLISTPKKINNTFINKEHYDKLYITDISLTYLLVNNILKPVTYNKNYTSFSEDLIYTKILKDIKKLIIPHPFLAISKCKIDHTNFSKTLNTFQKYEILYILLPYDDVENCKLFEIKTFMDTIESTINDQINTKTNIQNDEIIELNKKINNIIGGFDDIKDNIVCSIKNKTDTKIYQNKYSNTKNVLLSNKNNESTLLVLIDKNIIVMDKNTNISTYKKIFNEYKNYNEKYMFSNNMDITKLNPITINKKLPNNEGLIILEFITNYLLNTISNDNYKKKYIKYKMKYLYLKNKLQL